MARRRSVGVDGPTRVDTTRPPPPAKRARGAPSTPSRSSPRTTRRDHGEDTHPRRSRGRRRRALDPRRGRRLSRLAPRRPLPDLWRDIARKRFGFSHDLGHGFGLLPGDETNRELCRRVITSPEAPFDYVRGRWWRAVANLRRYRVILRHPSAPRDRAHRDDEDEDDPSFDARISQLDANVSASSAHPARASIVEYARLRSARRNAAARRRASRGDPRVENPSVPVLSPPRTRTTSTPRTSRRRGGAHRPEREEKGAHRPGDDGGGGGSATFSRENGVATATATVDAFEPGAAVVTDHALALTFRIEQAMLIGIMAGGDRVRVTIEAETNRPRGGDGGAGGAGAASCSRFARLCEFTATTGVEFRPSTTPTREGGDDVPARILVDGAAFLSARAPDTFTHEYFHPSAASRGIEQTSAPARRAASRRLSRDSPSRRLSSRRIWRL